jgi:hypothetical protein
MNQLNRDRKKAWKTEQKVLARNTFPLSDELLESLFKFVETSVDANGCDHSRRFTEKWLGLNKVSPESVLRWLESNGGFCDCEVIFNAMQHWRENRDITKTL